MENNFYHLLERSLAQFPKQRTSFPFSWFLRPLATLQESFLPSLPALSAPPCRTRGEGTACCTLRSLAAPSSPKMRELGQTVETVPRARGHPSAWGRPRMPGRAMETPALTTVGPLCFVSFSSLQRGHIGCYLTLNSYGLLRTSEQPLLWRGNNCRDECHYTCFTDEKTETWRI